MTKKKSASDRRQKRVRASALFTKEFSEKQKRELQVVATMPDTRIDYSDAPEAPERNSETYFGRFHSL